MAGRALPTASVSTGRRGQAWTVPCFSFGLRSKGGLMSISLRKRASMGRGICRAMNCHSSKPALLKGKSSVYARAAARAYTDDFPLSKAGLLEWQFIALQIPLPIEALFRSEIDINPPFDRSPKEKQGTVHA